VQAIRAPGPRLAWLAGFLFLMLTPDLSAAPLRSLTVSWMAPRQQAASGQEHTAAEASEAAEAAELAGATMPDDVRSLFPDDPGLVKAIEKVIEREQSQVLITNDAVIFGILVAMLGLIFWTSSIKSGFWGLFYKIVPMLLVCYFLPSLLTFFGLVDHKVSHLYFVATRYLLPATLVLLTLSIDLQEIMKLGPKALIMFFTGTVGVIIGGPLAVLIVGTLAPEIIGVDGPDALWRGLSTVAGSWIGGGANQAAMQVVFMSPAPDATEDVRNHLEDLYSVMVAVDVFVAEIWMLFLLLGVGKAASIDRFLKADASSIDHLQQKMEEFSLSVARIPSATDLMVIAAIGFGATAVAHIGGTQISNYVSSQMAENPSWQFLGDLGLASSFFWLIVLSTTIGILISFTPLRNYEGAGASKIGTVFIFMLVAVIGMQMDIRAIVERPGFFVVGGVWMFIHVSLMFLMAWLIRAPYFFLAVGSKANIGGAASAPVVAAAFHPALAPVGVLLAVLGYALGTYGAMLCAWMMQMATPAAG
jgi:uncharacterized membrane protein